MIFDAYKALIELFLVEKNNKETSNPLGCIKTRTV